MTTIYFIGSNQPGFMPDNAPDEAHTATEALAYLKELMRRDAEMVEWSDEDTSAIETITPTLNGEFGATLYGQHYFISRG